MLCVIDERPCMKDSPETTADEDAEAGAAGAEADAVTADEAAAAVEAVLFAADTPMNAAKIAYVGELPGRDVKKAVDALNERYDRTGSTFRIEQIAGGYQMLTRPEYRDIVSRLFESRKDTRLTQAALETLAIVAYRQPILRADVEAIRGVACGDVLRGLMEKQMIKIVARAEVLGRPMLYGTTRRFLETFGLKGLEDLPKVEELKGGAKDAPAAEAPAEPDEPEEPDDDVDTEEDADDEEQDE